jgi:thiol-disulfide isomerase/thioredoxin
MKQGSPTELLIGLEGLFSGSDDSTAPFQAQGKAKPAFFRGQKAVVIHLTGQAGPIALYLDADALSPIAFTTEDGKNTAVYKDLVFDAPMKAEEFAWTPPADAKSMKDTMAQGGGDTGASPAGDENSKLLKEGTVAPDFTLQTPTGGSLTLSKSLGKKGTIVNFWADFCEPCHMEMPVFVKIYKELKDQGLEIISIDGGDDAKTILKDAKENGFTYLLGMNGQGDSDVATKYGVEAIPTNYFLDPSGKIVAVIVGFDEAGLKAALKKLGFELK